MKKLFTVLTVTTLTILTTLKTFAVFSDVPADHPNFAAINYVQTQGIVSGYPDGTYQPWKTINRAEFTKILIASVFEKTVIDGCQLIGINLFSDVPRGQWFAPYVCIAKSNQVISGYSDGTFRPNNEINFAEGAKIIALSFSLKLGPGENWYDPYVNALGAKGAIPVSITSPDQKLTRAEMAEIIYRLQTGEGTFSNSANSTGNFDQLKNQIIDSVNKERAKEGLGPLRYSAILETSAQLHADDMQLRDFFEHVNPDGKDEQDRIIAAGYLDEFNRCHCTKSYLVGENLAKGQSTPVDVMDSWMKSPGHRANILEPAFSEIGIGITKITSANAGNFTGYFWVQNFGNVDLKKTK